MPHYIPHIVAAVRVLPHLGQSLLKQVGNICNGSLGVHQFFVLVESCFDQIGAQQCAVDRLRCAAVQSGEHLSRLCGIVPFTVFEVNCSGYCVVRTRKVVEVVFGTCGKHTKALGVTVVEGDFSVIIFIFVRLCFSIKESNIGDVNIVSGSKTRIYGYVVYFLISAAKVDYNCCCQR